MRFLAAELAGCVNSLDAADLLPTIESAPVLVGHPHLVLQHVANQLGNGGVFFSRFLASLSGGFLADRDGNVFQREISVTRTHKLLPTRQLRNTLEMLVTSDKEQVMLHR